MKFATAALLGLTSAQQVGHQKADYHPALSLQTCTTSGGCVKAAKAVTMDANWRWTHETSGYQNCYSGDSWNPKDCPDPVTCAKNCALDGVPQSDWRNTYGVETDGDALTLGFVTQTQYGKNVGSRTYMMAEKDKYEMFKLLNREFTVDVDESNLPCGLNGALYFVEMPEDGGSGKHPGNKAGAAYGTGYCDAQCPHDVKFIDGKANTEGWKPSPPNSGFGKVGSCCAEMDIWEANSISGSYTAHPCSFEGQKACTGTDCGDNASNERYDGLCDKDGCDLNPYRVGVRDFYGPGSQFTVDTTRPFSVVTQFLTHDGTDTGDLSEIKRLFIQDNKAIPHPASTTPGTKAYSSISDPMCDAFKTAFGDHNDFRKKGGLKQMGEALGRGMVLVQSLWDDADADMLWLDSTSPPGKTGPGGPRGSCPTSSGRPADVESKYPNSRVKFGNVRTGEIGSTFSGNMQGGPHMFGLAPPQFPHYAYAPSSAPSFIH